jgi:hypothetical protein
VSRTGLPALEQVLDNTRPLLAQVDPWLRNVIPIVDYLGMYRREIVSFFSLDAAASQATANSQGKPLHYLRTTNPTSPEILAAYPRRLPTNRSNPYVEPGGALNLATKGHLQVLDSYYCRGGGSPPPPVPVAGLLTPELAGLIDQFVFGGTENTGAAPPCDPQEPLGRKIGQTGVYPRLQAIAPGASR